MYFSVHTSESNKTLTYRCKSQIFVSFWFLLKETKFREEMKSEKETKFRKGNEERKGKGFNRWKFGVRNFSENNELTCSPCMTNCGLNLYKNLLWFFFVVMWFFLYYFDFNSMAANDLLETSSSFGFCLSFSFLSFASNLYLNPQTKVSRESLIPTERWSLSYYWCPVMNLFPQIFPY